MDSLSLSDSRKKERQLWEQLAIALKQAQGALLQHELCSFEACTDLQQLCVRELSALAARTTDGPGDPTDQSTSNAGLAQLRQQVSHLSRIERALLRRALHSLRILRNLAGHSTYRLAADGASGSMVREG